MVYTADQWNYVNESALNKSRTKCWLKRMVYSDIIDFKSDDLKDYEAILKDKLKVSAEKVKYASLKEVQFRKSTEDKMYFN